MIPKTLHHVWIGSKAFPEKMRGWAESFRQLHPAWRMVLWVDSASTLTGEGQSPWDEVVRLGPSVSDHLVAKLPLLCGAPAACIAARSDILRYEIVAREGGVYSDTDVEWFQPIDDLLDGVRLFCADQTGGVCGNYLFGSTKNHPAMWAAVRLLETRMRSFQTRDEESRRTGEGPRAPFNPVGVTGPMHLAEAIAKHPDYVGLPFMLCNPLPGHTDYSLVQRWPAASVCNHHYAGTWYKSGQGMPPAEFRDASRPWSP